MEKDINLISDVLSWLPIGYMISYPCVEIPTNFIEVDGQRMSKTIYPDLFDALRGTVVDEGDHFVLPSKVEIASKFESANQKIIIKIFNS